MSIKEKIMLRIKNTSKRKKIFIVLLFFALLYIVYDFMYYTIDIGEEDEIAVIRMFEPFNGPVYIITDKEIIHNYLNDIDGKRLTNDGISHLSGKANRICFYNEKEEAVFEFYTLGGDTIIVKWGILSFFYKGDIDAGVSMFEEYGTYLGYSK